jgi:hypothetical protein
MMDGARPGAMLTGDYRQMSSVTHISAIRLCHPMRLRTIGVDFEEGTKRSYIAGRPDSHFAQWSNRKREPTLYGLRRVGWDFVLCARDPSIR